MRKWYTVKDMLQYAVEHELKLLSSYESAFWNEYRDHHIIYDKLFERLYGNYRYFNQDIENEEETLDEVTIRFINDVGMHLLVNDKKYNELKRVNDLTDTEYGLFDNIDYTRIETGTGSENGTNVLGQRRDTVDTVSGERSDETTEQVNAFDGNGYSDSSKTTTKKGREVDTETVQKGEETDTTTKTLQDSRNINVKGKDNYESKTSLISSFENHWNRYKYYQAIFNDIAIELLLV